MAPRKRQDEVSLIEALLYDIHGMHGALFNSRALKNTIKIVRRRVSLEGLSFLTKTLPRLGKALDKALSGAEPLNCIKLRFIARPGTQLPMFMGELFSVILDSTGVLLPEARAATIRELRALLYLFYKYELEYSTETEQEVLRKFVKTEEELSAMSDLWPRLEAEARSLSTDTLWRRKPLTQALVVRRAQMLLERVHQSLDLQDIRPAHGPGAVATRQKLWSKYEWKNVCRRITDVYPFDAYFCASLGHVCDIYQNLSQISDCESPARVILVPKDSRGPRLISCEPVDHQWIQQGIMRATVRRVEDYHLTRWNVFFTDQGPNQRGALLGSLNGRYATLDLNEASDRVSVGLVNLLFPETAKPFLFAARSLSTVLPNSSELRLQKFAPMGSATCFTTLALTIWSILTAAAPDRDTRERILVYGDDVIVPTAFAEDAMEQLESFGLRINRDKSCIKGSFRESCGTDAFKGESVTPVRFRTVWSSAPSPEVYTSWIAYANAAFDRHYFSLYDKIVEMLILGYGSIPSDDMNLSCPSLREVPESARPQRWRTNHKLQKREWLVRHSVDTRIRHEMNGWDMLLRFFSESGQSPAVDDLKKRHSLSRNRRQCDAHDLEEDRAAFSVRVYTPRGRSMLRYRWT